VRIHILTPTHTRAHTHTHTHTHAHTHSHTYTHTQETCKDDIVQLEVANQEKVGELGRKDDLARERMHSEMLRMEEDFEAKLKVGGGAYGFECGYISMSASIRMRINSNACSVFRIQYRPSRATTPYPLIPSNLPFC
jgi:hypothetical protein